MFTYKFCDQQIKFFRLCRCWEEVADSLHSISFLHSCPSSNSLNMFVYPFFYFFIFRLILNSIYFFSIKPTQATLLCRVLSVIRNPRQHMTMFRLQSIMDFCSGPPHLKRPKAPPLCCSWTRGCGRLLPQARPRSAPFGVDYATNHYHGQQRECFCLMCESAIQALFFSVGVDGYLCSPWAEVLDFARTWCQRYVKIGLFCVLAWWKTEKSWEFYSRILFAEFE